ncbi:MAG TPA: aldo/keto reductase, partial [Tepidisphaeraceae bacterium]|nr:aldo/keto reductase [Tepidisphaeraceae bacterium]
KPFSNNALVDRIEQALALCDKRGFDRPRGSQPSYSLLQRDIEERVMPLCHANGIGQVVYSPLAQGILTGKYKPGQPLPPGSRGSDDRQNQFIKSRLDDQQLLARVQQLEPIAREQGCTMAQLALAWILRRPEVSSCIVGATKISQLEDNAAASGIPLSAETIAKMEAALAG